MTLDFTFVFCCLFNTAKKSSGII